MMENSYVQGVRVRRARLAQGMGVVLLLISAAVCARGASPMIERTGEAGDQMTFGVPLYPGATPDTHATEFLQNSGMRGTAYRTAAALGKVTAFYGAQHKLKRRGELAEESVLFGAGCKEEYVAVMKKTISLGCDIDVTLQSPWMDPQTGEMRTGTLISIVDNRDR